MLEEASTYCMVVALMGVQPYLVCPSNEEAGSRLLLFSNTITINYVVFLNPLCLWDSTAWI